MAQNQAPAFDPVRYKQTTREQWEAAAHAWNAWGPFLRAWLGPVTQTMLDLARVGPGDAVLDVAAGAGDQTLMAAERVGPTGRVLATDISPSLLQFAAANAQQAGHANVETQTLDGEDLDVPEAAFDVVISRVGLIYFPDQQRALAGMRRALKPGGRVAAIVYSTPENNKFFSGPVGIIRRRANLPPPLPGQPGPFRGHGNRSGSGFIPITDSDAASPESGKRGGNAIVQSCLSWNPLSNTAVRAGTSSLQRRLSPENNFSR